LFETADGWRYSLWVTNLAEHTRRWRGQLAYIDAAHRVHARVEDGIRTGKDCGIGKYPSTSLAKNKAWQAAALTAATLLAWLRLLALDGHLAHAEPKTLRSHPARRRPPGTQRPPALPQDRCYLALGTGDHGRLEPRQRPCPGTLTSTKPSRRSKEGPTGPWNPGHPARQPGPRHTRTLKSRPTTLRRRHFRPATGRHE
jgi:hypothetical protein